MVFTIYQLIRTARPRQWLKNLSLFAAAVFAGRLFDHHIFNITILAFIAFSLLSSGTYFLNDIIDAPRDRLHPVKKNRPIASGRLNPKLALLSSVVLILAALYLGFAFIGTYFSVAMLLYLAIQLSYSLYFRNIIILDSMVVATGFVLRVFAGGLATYISISAWLLLATIGISLLLAFGKRRSEKTILTQYTSVPQTKEQETRKTLRHYPDTLLDSMISMSAAYTIISYSLFVFQISPQTANDVLFNILPSILKTPKWMMLTIPLVIYGVARYLYVIYEKGEAESPERVLLSDKPLLATVLLWGIATLIIIFFLPLFA